MFLANRNATRANVGQDTSSCCHTARMAPKMLDANAKMKAEIEAAGSLKKINGPVRRSLEDVLKMIQDGIPSCGDSVISDRILCIYLSKKWIWSAWGV